VSRNSRDKGKFKYLHHVCDNEKMRKTTYGLLWNLKSHHIDASPIQTHDEKKMIL
jgi:hypothetical protein